MNSQARLNKSLTHFHDMCFSHNFVYSYRSNLVYGFFMGFESKIKNMLLKMIIGRDYARVNHLLPLREDFEDSYEEFLNPTTMTSFAAAAFRAFHSNIQGFIE